MKYSGRLAKPITRRPVNLLTYEDSARNTAEAEVAEMFDKLPDLFIAHGVAKDNWMGLAIALAKAHVPGFKFIEPAGRKTEWTVLDKAELRIDVDTIRIGSDKTLDASIREAVKGARWADKVQGMKTPALRQHYYHADELWVGVVLDARAYRHYERTGEILERSWKRIGKAD